MSGSFPLVFRRRSVEAKWSVSPTTGVPGYRAHKIDLEPRPGVIKRLKLAASGRSAGSASHPTASVTADGGCLSMRERPDPKKNVSGLLLSSRQAFTRRASQSSGHAGALVARMKHDTVPCRQKPARAAAIRLAQGYKRGSAGWSDAAGSDTPRDGGPGCLAKAVRPRPGFDSTSATRGCQSFVRVGSSRLRAASDLQAKESLHGDRDSLLSSSRVTPSESAPVQLATSMLQRYARRVSPDHWQRQTTRGCTSHGAGTPARP
jgi:hypothetical protein